MNACMTSYVNACFENIAFWVLFIEYMLLSIMVDNHSTNDAGPALDNGGTVVNEVTKQQVVVQYLKVTYHK